MLERYYVKVKGSLGCQVAHDTLADAFAEAKRLHEINQCKKRVYVMQVVGLLESDPPPDKKRPRLSRQRRMKIAARAVAE